jgi:uncharacterized protein DUF3883
MVVSGWLSPVRIRRAIHALAVLPSAPDAWAVNEARRLVWSRIGGPYTEVEKLLDLLTEMGLVESVDGRLARLKAAAPLVAGSEQELVRRFGEMLVRQGCFGDQARMLFENGRIGAGGELVCTPRIAHAGAPQLLGLLSYWEGVEMLPEVKIPPALLETLGLGTEVLWPVDDLQPTWVREQKAVGNRAESYSVKWLRSSASDPTRIAWVAKDTDSLGYDIEDRSVRPYRAVEVKGSRSKEVAFIVSAKELDKANELGPRYFLHFWGGIDLNRPVDREYTALLSSGYPLILSDLAAELRSATWLMTPDSWRVTRRSQ